MIQADGKKKKKKKNFHTKTCVFTAQDTHSAYMYALAS